MTEGGAKKLVLTAVFVDFEGIGGGVTTDEVRRVGSGEAVELPFWCTGMPKAGVTTEPKRRVGTGMFGSVSFFFGATGSSFGANQALGSALRCEL